MGSGRNGGGTDRPAEEENKGGVPPAAFEMPEIRFNKLFINGRFVDAVSGRYHRRSTHNARMPISLLAPEGELQEKEPVVDTGKTLVPIGELASDNETMGQLLRHPRPPIGKILGQSGSGTKKPVEEIILLVPGAKKKCTMKRPAHQSETGTKNGVEDGEMEDASCDPIAKVGKVMAVQKPAPVPSPPLKLPRFKLRKITKKTTVPATFPDMEKNVAAKRVESTLPAQAAAKPVEHEEMELEPLTVVVADIGGSGTAASSRAGGHVPPRMEDVMVAKRLYLLFTEHQCKIVMPHVSSCSGRTFETRDPRTGEVIATVAEGDKEDVDLAVKAARDAFDHGEWPLMSGSERGRIMTRFADLVEQHADELAALESLDAGKHPAVTKAVDIGNAAGSLRYFAGAADKIHGETLKMQGQFQGYTLREPLGVAGLIIPWNFPTTMFGIKVAPALAAGCTMVVKPAEQTPLSALYLADLAKKAGIPDGVINVVPGFGPTAGAAIASHMNVEMISFTGSTEVGRLIMEASARSNLKPVYLELGGKSPLIIFDDADLDMAVELAISANFFNKGEACIAASRVYVQESIYDGFEKKLAERMKTWVVGDPLNDPTVNQGPQVDKAQYERVLSYIEHGKREGATLLTGGKPCGQKGYYIEPTVFTNVKEDMIIAKEEIFGPVMCLMKFKTVEEAIARANETPYGLGAGVVTRDLDVANRVVRSVRAGLVWVNCYFAVSSDCPFGGRRMSGFGKDEGMHALDKFLAVKSVVTPLRASPWM
ncbi:Aldehyde dehydrogenase family 2 member C4 [Dichanthelium oligosanthes]|uniref:Aldehyde dehydrogenase 1 n=1 Tax=Dichanthelium oligosanthes TaxID=888268 RepID=A0A1E5VDX4_9POAL|nr:Aldehyde dehydrogenase family 2 member C4 [Dichanthelium oligosanthes]